MAFFAALTLAAMTFQTGRWASAPVAEALAQLSAPVAAAVVVAIGVAGIGAWMATVHFFGPVGVDKLTQLWRVPPGSAAQWLRERVKRRRILLLAAAAFAAIWVGFTLPATALVSVPCAALVFVLTGSTSLAAIAAQHHDAAALVGGTGIVMVLLGIALFLLVTAPTGMIPLGGAAVVVARRTAIRGTVRAAFRGRKASRRAGKAADAVRTPEAVIPRWQLTRGAESLDAVSASAVCMEARPMTNLRYRRAASTLRRLRVPGMPAPARAAWLTGRRSLSTTRVVALLGLVGLPAGFTAVGTVPFAAALALALTVWVSTGAAASFEQWLDSPAVRRTVPVGRSAGAAALAAPVAAATFVFAAVTVAASGLSTWWIAAAGAAAVLAHIRRWRARSVPWKIGPIIMTEMGAIPLGVVSRVIAGSDAVAIAAVLALVGVSAPVVTGIVAVTAAGYLVRLRLAGEAAHS